MKAILYAGATLMIGASIYGVADFRKTSQEKEFRTMYNEMPAANEPETAVTTTEPVKEITVAPEKTRKAAVRKTENGDEAKAVSAPEPNDNKTIKDVSKTGNTIGLVRSDKPVKAVKK